VLSEVEEFILGGDVAHNLVSLEKSNECWIIIVSPVHDETVKKKYKFENASEEYEQDLTDEGEELEFPLPIIGFDSTLLPNKMWRFCLNVLDIEWGFVSKWPTKA